MALEAVVFPLSQDLFVQNSRELYSIADSGHPRCYDEFSGGLLVEKDELDETKGMIASECDLGVEMYHAQQKKGWDDLNYAGWDPFCSSLVHNFEDWDVNSSPEISGEGKGMVATVTGGRRKRRRTKSCKNKEEVENQRMTHIAVERNRRKQMNEYLAVLRSLMPPSYVQRGDQASIIGGAINYVKELEQLHQSLEAHKQINNQNTKNTTTPQLFLDFFSFPQYSTHSTRPPNVNTGDAEDRPAIADVEVNLVESHANLKILSKRRPKQLLKVVVGLQNLLLTILHLNVTTIEQMVLYSFNLKVEDDCQLTSVDEIATAVHQLLGRVQDDCGSSTMNNLC